ncbi:MAG: VanW family protein [Leptospirales bacterium]
MQNKNQPWKPAKNRSAFRLWVGSQVYILQRFLYWLKARKRFAFLQSEERLKYTVFSHHTPLIRKLKKVDLQLQYNKVDNLKIAIDRITDITLEPGEIFSFWRLVGKPTRSKGYKTGFTLKQGKVVPGTGGGLCQLSNLIYWMSLHTPLEVIERHRHSYDVFPDEGRTQPFGSGATVSYNYIDLQILNRTAQRFQLSLWLDETHLQGRWLSDYETDKNYTIKEETHQIRHEMRGIYSRHNRIVREVYSKLDNKLIDTEFVAQNHALLMYNPLLTSNIQNEE